MLAVLGDAARCIQRYALARSTHGKMLFAETMEWFESTESEWLFSFESICNNLGFAPDEIRRALPKGKPSRASRVSTAPCIVPLRNRRLRGYRNGKRSPI